MSELSNQELDMIKEYFRIRSKYNRKIEAEQEEDFLIQHSPLFLGIIRDLGEGDPELAAIRHEKALIHLHMPPTEKDTFH